MYIPVHVLESVILLDKCEYVTNHVDFMPLLLNCPRSLIHSVQNYSTYFLQNSFQSLDQEKMFS